VTFVALSRTSNRLPFRVYCMVASLLFMPPPTAAGEFDFKGRRRGDSSRP
jgi:hypothetical protein